MKRLFLFFPILILAIAEVPAANCTTIHQHKERNENAEEDMDLHDVLLEEVNGEDFIYFKKRACNISDKSDYVVKSNVNKAAMCEGKCIKKTWCLGYEFRRQTEKNNGSRCVLFNVTPNPKETRKKDRLCAQHRFRGGQPPSTQPSEFPTMDIGGNWTFLVFADLHSFESFSWRDLEENKQTKHWDTLTRVLTSIQDNYGGELVLLPGDQVSYGRLKTLQSYVDHFGGNLSAHEATYKAALNSGKTSRTLFGEVGYDTVLATIGDHEIGGNIGFVRKGAKKSKLITLPTHRQGFGDGFNRNEDGEFLFDQLFGSVPSRPLGTVYENTTYAYTHKNALFVTVDAFELIGDGTEDYFDRENGLGGEGAVTCTVSGEHLAWFESILSHGRDSRAIDHIFVQAHLPIIQPVQKVDTSGQFFDRADESDFWNVMNEYGVDIYFAGDVHANTATKSSHGRSDLVQIISRGNVFNNFLTLTISNDIIDVNIYNEYGDEWKFNAQYEAAGHLTIDKSSRVTEISSSGMLELLNAKSEIISFDFEAIFPLGTRQVLSMGDSNSLMVTEVTIRNELCTDSMFNMGGFGAQYDAQVCNITLIEGREMKRDVGLIREQVGRRGDRGFAGSFHEKSRFGIYGTGPFSGGEIVSLGVWIRTTEVTRRMVLVHYADYWGSVSYVKDHFTLTLDNGVPVVNTQPNIQLKPAEEMNLADGSWHHIGISMPHKSCKVSQLEIYVDGLKISDTIVMNDRHIFYTTSGRLSLGGFGYSNSGFEDAYPNAGPFIGEMDDFVSFARPLYLFVGYPNVSCDKSSPEDYVTRDKFKNCYMQCIRAGWCLGYERTWVPEDKCILFKVLPMLGESKPGTTCYQAGWL